SSGAALKTSCGGNSNGWRTGDAPAAAALGASAREGRGNHGDRPGALPPVLLLVVPGPSVRGAGLSPPHRASLTAREGPTASPTTTGWAAPAAPRTLVAPRSRRCCASMPSAQAQLAVVVWQGAEVRARARQE